MKSLNPITYGLSKQTSTLYKGVHITYPSNNACICIPVVSKQVYFSCFQLCKHLAFTWTFIFFSFSWFQWKKTTTTSIKLMQSWEMNNPEIHFQELECPVIILFNGSMGNHNCVLKHWILVKTHMHARARTHTHTTGSEQF